MIEIHSRVETDWPIDQVANYLCDFTTTAQWHPHTMRCSRLDSGPVVVGSEFDNVQRVGVVRTSRRYRVVDLHAGRSITLRSSTRSAELIDTITFAGAESGGTAVTYVARVRLKGLAKAGESSLRGLLGRIGRDAAAGMARTLAQLDAASPTVG